MATPGMTYRPIRCDVLTMSYRIVGNILVPSNGLGGVLNNKTNSFQEIQNAQLARMHMPTKLIENYDIARLVKSQIIAVCVGRREDLGPLMMARGGYQNTIPYSVFITTPIYEITGTLEWTGRFDFTAIMVEGTRDFIPLYSCTIRAILIPNVVIESPAMFINRKQVDLLALATQKPTENS